MLRLVFIVIYLIAAIWIVIRDFAWLNTIFGLLMLFGCYISIVKSGLIKDVNADSINDFSFDFLSIAITLCFFIDILFAIL